MGVTLLSPDNIREVVRGEVSPFVVGWGWGQAQEREGCGAKVIRVLLTVLDLSTFGVVMKTPSWIYDKFMMKTSRQKEEMGNLENVLGYSD